MLDNYPQVMIEIYHGGKLILIMNKALLFGMGFKFLYIQIINSLGQQAIDDLFKIQPPSLQNKMVQALTPLIMTFAQKHAYIQHKGVD